jgi:hypothetical protein
VGCSLFVLDDKGALDRLHYIRYREHEYEKIYEINREESSK